MLAAQRGEKICHRENETVINLPIIILLRLWLHIILDLYNIFGQNHITL